MQHLYSNSNLLGINSWNNHTLIMEYSSCKVMWDEVTMNSVWSRTAHAEAQLVRKCRSVGSLLVRCTHGCGGNVHYIMCVTCLGQTCSCTSGICIQFATPIPYLIYGMDLQKYLCYSFKSLELKHTYFNTLQNI